MFIDGFLKIKLCFMSILHEKKTHWYSNFSLIIQLHGFQCIRSYCDRIKIDITFFLIKNNTHVSLHGITFMPSK